MDNRNPALDLMVAGPVHPVGKAYRRCGSGGLQAGESGGIVDHVIGNQNFFSSTGLEVARGGVIETAKDADASEEQNVGPVPESVGWRGLGW